VSTVDAVEKGGLDTVLVGGGWVPGEREGGDGGRVFKRGGMVNDKTVQFAIQNKADDETDKALVLVNKALSGAELAMLGLTRGLLRLKRHFPSRNWTC